MILTNKNTSCYNAIANEVEAFLFCQRIPVIYENARFIRKNRQSVDNRFLLGRNMREIPLTQGKVALVDDENFEWLSQWKWYCNNGYAVRQSEGNHKTRKRINMHRQIINAPKGIQVDHIDQNTLNNQQENLRLCTSSENSRNCRLPKSNTSRYRGIHKCRGKWLTNIKINGIQTYLGSFSIPEDAAKAYDKKAQEVDGKFARTNFPE